MAFARKFTPPRYWRLPRSSQVRAATTTFAAPATTYPRAGVQILSQDEQNLARIVFVVRQLCEGRSNSTGSFTLTANAAFTTVTALTCGGNSAVLCFPSTANAAAEWKNGTMTITAQNQQFTILHANNAQTDRTFMYAVFG